MSNLSDDPNRPPAPIVNPTQKNLFKKARVSPPLADRSGHDVVAPGRVGTAACGQQGSRDRGRLSAAGGASYPRIDSPPVSARTGPCAYESWTAEQAGRLLAWRNNYALGLPGHRFGESDRGRRRLEHTESEHAVYLIVTVSTDDAREGFRREHSRARMNWDLRHRKSSLVTRLLLAVWITVVVPSLALSLRRE
jgi:hypothetical protein